MKLVEFLIKAKTKTYADGIKYKVTSTKLNSIDYHYTEGKYIYHDTYFGSKEFYGEEIVYLGELPIWHMEYKGGVLNNETTDIYTKVLKPALKKVNSEFPLRGPKEFIVDNYQYTFEVTGDLDSFKGIERIYKKDKLLYELICYGGKYKKENYIMFKCPKCGNKLKNFKCEKCHHEITIHNGVKYFCDEENINTKDDGHKYIGYDDINIHFSPSLIYWGLDHYGIYGVSAEDIAKRYGEGIVVLDLGCGLGQATIPFAKAGAVVIGADISEKMLEFSYQRSEGKYDNLHLCKMNAYNLNLEDESVDVVVENAMIHLVDNPEQVYKEIYRVLKKDGKFIRFTSPGLPITEEQKQLSINSRNAFKDVRNYYYEVLNELGYEPVDFDNNSFEIEKKYFYIPQGKENHIVLDYEEEFTEFIKFRIYRLEHKAHSFLQHIPDNIHQVAWKKADEYAKAKYGENYKEMKSYSHYNAGYDIYLKKE